MVRAKVSVLRWSIIGWCDSTLQPGVIPFATCDSLARGRFIAGGSRELVFVVAYLLGTSPHFLACFYVHLCPFLVSGIGT